MVSDGARAPLQATPGRYAWKPPPLTRRCPRRSRGQGRGGVRETVWVTVSPRRLTWAGESTRISGPSATTSRICSSCSQTSFFSSVRARPAGVPVGAGRFQKAIQTWMSSPLRASSTSRNCDGLPEKVRRASTTGAISLMRPPASRTTAAKATRARVKTPEATGARLLQLPDTGSPRPANATVFRASSRTAPARSSAAGASQGRRSRSAERTAEPSTPAIIAHRAALPLAIAHADATMRGVAADRVRPVGAVNAVPLAAQAQPPRAQRIALAGGHDLPLGVPGGVGDAVDDLVDAGGTGRFRRAHRGFEDTHGAVAFQHCEFASRNADHDTAARRARGVVLGQCLRGSHQHHADRKST